MKTHSNTALMAGLIAAVAAGAALAGGGDNGMNPFYGDSWAALEGNGVNLTGAQTPPGAGVAHEGTEPLALHAFADRVNHAEAAMSEHWQHATQSMAAAMHGLATPSHVTQPLVSTPTDPFDEKGGN